MQRPEQTPIPSTPEILTPEEHTITYGNKKLEITLEPIHNGTRIEAIVYIKAIPEKKKIAGDTTEIYKRLKIFLQQYANNIRLPIEYSFITDNPKLIAWENTAGKNIFDWGEPKKFTYTDNHVSDFMWSTILYPQS